MLAGAFLRSPLFSDFADAMSLRMSLAEIIFANRFLACFVERLPRDFSLGNPVVAIHSFRVSLLLR